MKIYLDEGDREATPIRFADCIINFYSDATTNQEDARSNVKELAMHLYLVKMWYNNTYRILVPSLKKG